MLLQRQSPLATRCSTWWRLAAVTIASLLIGTSILFVGVNPAYAQVAAERTQDQEIATLRAERDQLAARLAEMEKRFNQMQAQMQQFRADAQAGEAERRLRMRNEEDQHRAAEQQVREQRDMIEAQTRSAQQAARDQQEQQRQQQRTQQGVTEEARRALQRRSDLQREQALAEHRQATSLDPNTRQPRTSDATADDAGVTRSKTPDRDANYAAQKTQLDLIALANAYIDASGNQRLRAIQLERLSKLVQNNVASNEELETAKVELDTATRKTRLFRAMAEAALRSAEAELQNTKHLITTGLAPTSSVHDAESKVLVLRQILSN